MSPITEFINSSPRAKNANPKRGAPALLESGCPSSGCDSEEHTPSNAVAPVHHLPEALLAARGRLRADEFQEATRQDDEGLLGPQLLLALLAHAAVLGGYPIYREAIESLLARPPLTA